MVVRSGIQLGELAQQIVCPRLQNASRVRFSQENRRRTRPGQQPHSCLAIAHEAVQVSGDQIGLCEPRLGAGARRDGIPHSERLMRPEQIRVVARERSDNPAHVPCLRTPACSRSQISGVPSHALAETPDDRPTLWARRQTMLCRCERRRLNVRLADTFTVKHNYASRAQLVPGYMPLVPPCMPTA